MEHTRVLNVVYRSATALGSRLPSIASARERVAGASAFLRPVSSSTQASYIVQHSVCESFAKFHNNLNWTCANFVQLICQLERSSYVIIQTQIMYCVY